MKKRKPKILVVDDDPSLLEMMSLSLRWEGYSIHVAGSAGGAREPIEGPDFEVVGGEL